MITAIIILFIIGYALIAFEHPLKVDKTVPALLMGVGLWTIIALGHLGLMGSEGHVVLDGENYTDDMVGVLLHHVGKISEILIFLLGAMTIVELVDLHKGFSVITDRIRTTNKKTMMVIISVVTFFLSAVLDNLTTTIVMISLLRKLVPDHKERLLYVSMVVIAANAGGAWSPIGDVTTTMLWIGKKVTTVKLITSLILPSLVCLFVPVLILLMRKELRGSLQKLTDNAAGEGQNKKLLSSNIMFMVGISALIFVPIFKSITHLPPYLGMMMGLGVTWLVSEFIHPEENFDEERKHLYSARHALSRIEMSSILFFLGILLAITALESVLVSGVDGNPIGLLNSLAQQLQAIIPNQDFVIILIGVLSAIVDNVPLVAATMGMYTEPIDADLWHFIAYSAGTGGSMLIIGSAAGVAAMGMEKIDFIWYLKNIAWLAAAGFIGGCLVFMAFN